MPLTFIIVKTGRVHIKSKQKCCYLKIFRIGRYMYKHMYVVYIGILYYYFYVFLFIKWCIYYIIFTAVPQCYNMSIQNFWIHDKKFTLYKTYIYTAADVHDYTIYTTHSLPPLNLYLSRWAVAFPLTPPFLFELHSARKLLRHV